MRHSYLNASVGFSRAARLAGSSPNTSPTSSETHNATTIETHELERLRHNWESMTVAQIQIPETEITDLCRRNGIRKLALFGSVLTNRFSDASDVDVLVEFRPQERVGFFRLADVEAELSSLIGGRKVDVRTPMDLSRYFRDEVVRSALVLYAEP